MTTNADRDARVDAIQREVALIVMKYGPGSDMIILKEIVIKLGLRIGLTAALDEVDQLVDELEKPVG